MKRFLLKVALFVMPLIIVLVAVEYIDRRYSDTALHKKNRYLHEQADSITTLVFGTSHSYQGIDPAYLPGHAFSLAYISQLPSLDLALLEKFHPELPRLETVIVSMGYNTLPSPRIEDDTEWYNLVDYRSAYGISRHPALSRYSLYIGDNYLAIRRLKDIINKTENPHEMVDLRGHSLGYPYIPSDTLWVRNQVRKARKHTHPEAGKNVAKNSADFCKLAQYCEEKGLKLVVVSLPVSKDYLAAADPRQLAIIDTVVARMRRENPSMRYINLLRSPEFSIADGDFNDESHLSTDRGARKATIMIADSLRVAR